MSSPLDLQDRLFRRSRTPTRSRMPRGGCSTIAFPTCPSSMRPARFVGMFKLDRLYAALLPKAALLGDGMPDLAFVSDTLGQLREKMREIEHRAVREFVVQARSRRASRHDAARDRPAAAHGANNMPVVDRDTGKLVGMVSARDVLAALQRSESRLMHGDGARGLRALRPVAAVGGDDAVRRHLSRHHERQAQPRDRRAAGRGAR